MNINTDHLQHITPILEEAVQSGRQPTAVVAVANSRETLWTHAVPGSDGVLLDSIFLIASITKTVLATAVMRLVEEGKLLLTVPVAQYLPEFGANGKEEVTAFHLLTHSSGMEEEIFWAEFWEQKKAPLPGGLFASCCRTHLNYPPGTGYRYSTLPFSVLGELVTRLGKFPYPEYMQRHIMGPLGMNSTAFRPIDPQRAAPIHNLMEGDEACMEAWLAEAMPGAGLWSTAADLVRFGQAYLRGGIFDGYRLLSPATLEMMTRHYTQGQINLLDGKPFNFGLGWSKPPYLPSGNLLASPRAFGHHGASGTLLWIDPDYDLVFVYLSNIWGHNDPTDAKARALNVAYAALN